MQPTSSKIMIHIVKKGDTGLLYPEANSIMKDVEDHKVKGDQVGYSISEYDEVLAILDEAKEGRYPEASSHWSVNPEVWSNPIQIHARRCAALRKIFQHKIATGNFRPNARILINDLEICSSRSSEFKKKQREELISWSNKI